MSRNDPRRPPVAEKHHELLDTVADKAHDAIEFGDMDPTTAILALEEVVREIEDCHE